MARARITFLLSIVLVTLFASFGSAAAQSGDQITGFASIMVGTAEVAAPGDPDGVGIAALSVNATRSRVCWAVSVTDIAPATGAVLAKAPVGFAGDTILTLLPPSDVDGNSVGCVTVDPALIDDILLNTDLYYVSVQNAEYPAGALRGQLNPR